MRTKTKLVRQYDEQNFPDDVVDQSFGRYLTFFRNLFGYGTDDLADHLGWSIERLNELENGSCAIGLKKEELGALACFFDRPFSEVHDYACGLRFFAKLDEEIFKEELHKDHDSDDWMGWLNKNKTLRAIQTKKKFN